MSNISTVVKDPCLNSSSPCKKQQHPGKTLFESLLVSVSLYFGFICLISFLSQISDFDFFYIYSFCEILKIGTFSRTTILLLSTKHCKLETFFCQPILLLMLSIFCHLFLLNLFMPTKRVVTNVQKSFFLFHHFYTNGPFFFCYNYKVGVWSFGLGWV